MKNESGSVRPRWAGKGDLSRRDNAKAKFRSRTIQN